MIGLGSDKKKTKCFEGEDDVTTRVKWVTRGDEAEEKGEERKGEEGGEERRRGRRRKIVANGIKGSIKGPRGPKKTPEC